MSAPENHTRLLFSVIISLLVVLSLSGCMDMMFPGAEPPKLFSGPLFRNRSESVIPDPGEAGSAESGSSQGYAGDESISSGQTGQDGSTGADYGPLKPIGFVNYGEFDATVSAHTFMPLGQTVPATPPGASTVSSANDGGGDWPNTSRFISVPMGAYSWCIDWEEGDIDEDGQIDYFHYIQNEPTILDENDSAELEFAQEVAISAPPSEGMIYPGRCEEIEITCTEYTSEVNVYTYMSTSSDNPPDLKAMTNVAEYPSPAGIQVTSGGTASPWGAGMILWTTGDYTEATTSNPYTAFGAQIFGDHTIGWGRVLFDGVEIWRGDASTYTIMEGAQYGVYVEVRCFPPGTHTMRVECLGIEGSGGGRSLPSGYYGFKE